MFQIDFGAIPLRERFETWAAFNNQYLDKLRIEPVADHPFKAALAVQPLGDANLAQCNVSGFRLARTRSEIERTSAHCCVVTIHLDGVSGLRSGDSERRLQAGDVFILDTMHEFELRQDRPNRQLLFKLPQAAIEARIARPDLLAGAVLRQDNPLIRLFANYMVTSFETADRLSPSAAAVVTRHLLDLLAEATSNLPADTPPPLAAHRAALLAHARRVIALKFSDPELNPDAIARTMGVTTRTLHRLFAAHGESVMKTVLAERVQHAANLLAAPAARGRTITEIAFACGFNDLTHFGRAFEAQMHMTPSQWRRQHR